MKNKENKYHWNYEKKLRKMYKMEKFVLPVHKIQKGMKLLGVQFTIRGHRPRIKSDR